MLSAAVAASANFCSLSDPCSLILQFFFRREFRLQPQLSDPMSYPQVSTPLPQQRHHVVLLTSWSMKLLRRTGIGSGLRCCLPLLNACSRRLRKLLVYLYSLHSSFFLPIRKHPVLVSSVFLENSSLTLCWMCKTSMCFVRSSCSTFGFSKVLLFFFCASLVFAPALFCQLLAMLFSCLLLATLFRFFSSYLSPAVGYALFLPADGYASSLACCWLCSFASSRHLSTAVGCAL